MTEILSRERKFGAKRTVSRGQNRSASFTKEMTAKQNGIRLSHLKKPKSYHETMTRSRDDEMRTVSRRSASSTLVNSRLLASLCVCLSVRMSVRAVLAACRSKTHCQIAARFSAPHRSLCMAATIASHRRQLLLLSIFVVKYSDITAT